VLPKTVKIGSVDWAVIVSDIQISDGNLGSCYKERHEIHIAGHLSEAAKSEILIHEILHALCNFAGIGEEDSLTEEQFVARLEHPLHSLLKDNPNLLTRE